MIAQPYIDMTIGVMGQFGVEVERDALPRVPRAPRPALPGARYAIEPDASSAHYFSPRRR